MLLIARARPRVRYEVTPLGVLRNPWGVLPNSNTSSNPYGVTYEVLQWTIASQ